MIHVFMTQINDRLVSPPAYFLSGNVTTTAVGVHYYLMHAIMHQNNSLRCGGIPKLPYANQGMADFTDCRLIFQ